MDLSSKRIMLTGGAGFLGSFVAEKLKARGCKHIFIPKEQDYDLTKSDRIAAAFQDAGKLFSSSPDFRPSTFDSRPPLD
ncbi:MAG: NAD-dependent epimerase/dehydratase family protein, partial [Elusimicrobiota bacterium]|nr:NAD-dependent epimerase/dehydratase family protein [Elusimicrobiota bacterium]